MNVTASDRVYKVTLNNVVYAPGMDSNLLSITTLCDLGYETSFIPGKGARILKDGDLVADTIRQGNLFRLNTVRSKENNKTAYMTIKTIIIVIEPI